MPDRFPEPSRSRWRRINQAEIKAGARRVEGSPQAGRDRIAIQHRGRILVAMFPPTPKRGLWIEVQTQDTLAFLRGLHREVAADGGLTSPPFLSGDDERFHGVIGSSLPEARIVAIAYLRKSALA